MFAREPGTSRRWWCAALLGLCVWAAGAVPAEASFVQEGGPIAVGTNPYGVVAADFNLDGQPDVATVNGTSSTLSVLLRQGGGGFLADIGSPYATGVGPSYAATGDLNADGLTDVAVANYVSGTVTVLLRQAGGGFLEETPAPFAPSAGAIAAADFNGDGRLDLAVPNYNGGGVTVLLRTPTNNGYAAEAGTPPTGVNPRNLAVADFNADGRPDLAVTNSGSGTVSILLRNATNDGFTTEAGSPVAVGANPSGIVARDFNGDGRPDLALANYGSDTVSLLLRTPSGGFAEEGGSPLAVGDGPAGVASADFNADGLPDLAVANNLGGSVSVLLRQPGGSFAPDASSPLALPGANGVTAADFNSDGFPDLAATSDSASTLTAFLNTSPPPNPPPPGPPPGPLPTPVFSIDKKALSVAGALQSSKVPAALKEAIASAPLEAALTTPAAKTRVETDTQRGAGKAKPKATLEERLRSLVYGVPVQLEHQPPGAVDLAAVVTIERIAGAKREVTQLTLPATIFAVTPGVSVARIPVDATAAKELQTKGVLSAAITIQAEQITQAIDTMSELSDTESLRLQMAMDRLSKTMSALSNIVKKISDTSSTVVSNIKRTVAGVAAVSEKALQKQAAAAATQASVDGHAGAVLLATVVRPQVGGGSHATFVVSPCPKRCLYPGFGR